MSIQNRQIRNGTQDVLVEMKFQNLLAKIYCFFKGHKVFLVKSPKFERSYCVCCWKEMEE